MKKVNYVLLPALALAMSCTNTSKKTENKVEKTVAPTETVAPSTSFSQDDYTMFLAAALENQKEVIVEKLAAGIDVNYQDENNRTALMLASFNGHLEIVNLLIEKGANVAHVDLTNRSALMFACTGPFVETVKVLLEAGAEVNGIDNHENWTPIMFAAGEGQLEIIKVLLEAGADVTMVDVDGESSYDFALSNGHTATANFLKEIAQGK